MRDSFFSENELRKVGFSNIGTNVFLSRKASIFSPEKIEIGNNVRIDDFCILSGKIKIDSYVHIAAYSALFGGKAGIIIRDYANVSSRVCIYALSDDYSGKTMTNPMVPEKYKNVIHDSVMINKHVIIGSGSTVLPGVTLSEGTAVGAMSLVNRSTEEWCIYAGIPARKIKERSKDLLCFESLFERNERIV